MKLLIIKPLHNKSFLCSLKINSPRGQPYSTLTDQRCHLYNGTRLTVSLKINIIKRFNGGTKKCIGDACKKGFDNFLNQSRKVPKIRPTKKYTASASPRKPSTKSVTENTEGSPMVRTIPTRTGKIIPRGNTDASAIKGQKTLLEESSSVDRKPTPGLDKTFEVKVPQKPAFPIESTTSSDSHQRTSLPTRELNIPSPPLPAKSIVKITPAEALTEDHLQNQQDNFKPVIAQHGLKGSNSSPSTSATPQSLGLFGQKQSTGTTVTVTQTATVPSRGYATVTNNPWDPNTTDPQAPLNNPGVPVHHPEIRMNTCDQLGCSGRLCIGLCGNPVGSKAVGHFTHGFPDNLPNGNVVVNLDTTIDAKGLPDPQNAVIYKKAHSAGATTEIPHGTKFLNQPHVLDQIDKYADKT